MMKLAAILIPVTLFLGCATATQVPLANGVQGYAIECERSISHCYKKAAEVCAPAQYEIADQQQGAVGGMSGGAGAFVTKHALTITCKSPAP